MRSWLFLSWLWHALDGARHHKLYAATMDLAVAEYAIDPQVFEWLMLNTSPDVTRRTAPLLDDTKRSTGTQGALPVAAYLSAEKRPVAHRIAGLIKAGCCTTKVFQVRACVRGLSTAAVCVLWTPAGCSVTAFIIPHVACCCLCCFFLETCGRISRHGNSTQGGVALGAISTPMRSSCVVSGICEPCTKISECAIIGHHVRVCV